MAENRPANPAVR